MNEDAVRQALQAEAAPIAYAELQKFFARGVLLVIDEALDLVDVALALHRDEADALKHWLDSGQVCKAEAEHAAHWHHQASTLYAVTVSPWVLVQNRA